MKKLLLFSIILVSVISCTSEKRDVLTPGCDATISYSNDIQPILNAKCLTCHSSSFTYMSGPDLSTYELLKVKVDNGSVKRRVFEIRDMPMAGFPSITDAELGKLRCWLDQGARNN